MKRLPARTALARVALLCAPLCALLALCALSCQRGPDDGRLIVLNAGALARPLRAVIDSFAAHGGARGTQESAGSIETARKITDLGRDADLVAVADTSLFTSILAGRVERPIVPLGRSRMVLAYTARSRYAGEITEANWTSVLLRPGVEVGRSDPSLDPAGYRALFVFRLAENFYRRPGLADSLLRAAPTRNVRPKSADLIALLTTGNLDYAWEYEAVARSLGLRFVRLPAAVDLGDPAQAAVYATVSAKVRGAGRDSVVIRGAPVVFGAAVPLHAPHPDAAHRFLQYLAGRDARAIFARFGFEAGE